MRATPGRVQHRLIVAMVIVEPRFHVYECARNDEKLLWGVHLPGGAVRLSPARVGFHLIDGSRPIPDSHLGSADRRRFHSEVTAMSNQGLIILIVVLVLLFGGGGGYYWRRSRG